MKIIFAIIIVFFTSFSFAEDIIISPKEKNATFIMDGDGFNFLYVYDQVFYIPYMIPLTPSKTNINQRE
jgi:hypothetical protein